MITAAEYQRAHERSIEMLANAGIAITPAEAEAIEIADFGFGELDKYGLELLIYVNTDRVCAKELVMFPRQTCPEHAHPPVHGEAGKEETFRCRWGEVYVYTAGPASDPIKARLSDDAHSPYLQVRHEIVLYPGEQFTLYPETRHWFQAGPEGAIVSEFSTHSDDASDIFTDPRRRARTGRRVTGERSAAPISEASPGIGRLRERSLHAALKAWFWKPGDETEVAVDGYVIDLIHDQLLIEVQTRGLVSLRGKLESLLREHDVCVVYPLPLERWIVTLDAEGEHVLRRRKSPKRGRPVDLFDELVRHRRSCFSTRVSP